MVVDAAFGIGVPGGVVRWGRQSKEGYVHFLVFSFISRKIDPKVGKSRRFSDFNFQFSHFPPFVLFHSFCSII